MGRVLVILVALAVGACDGGIAEPVETPWPAPMTHTTCKQWLDEMGGFQRFAVAEAAVGFDSASRFVVAINEECTAWVRFGDPRVPVATIIVSLLTSLGSGFVPKR